MKKKNVVGFTKQGVRDLGGNNKRMHVDPAALGIEGNLNFGKQMACNHVFKPVDDYSEECQCGLSQNRIHHA